jgi:hypothetical protein
LNKSNPGDISPTKLELKSQKEEREKLTSSRADEIDISIPVDRV